MPLGRLLSIATIQGADVAVPLAYAWMASVHAGADAFSTVVTGLVLAQALSVTVIEWGCSINAARRLALAGPPGAQSGAVTGSALAVKAAGLGVSMLVLGLAWPTGALAEAPISWLAVYLAACSLNSYWYWLGTGRLGLMASSVALGTIAPLVVALVEFGGQPTPRQAIALIAISSLASFSAPFVAMLIREREGLAVRSAIVRDLALAGWNVISALAVNRLAMLALTQASRSLVSPSAPTVLYIVERARQVLLALNAIVFRESFVRLTIAQTRGDAAFAVEFSSARRRILVLTVLSSVALFPVVTLFASNAEAVVGNEAASLAYWTASAIALTGISIVYGGCGLLALGATTAYRSGHFLSGVVFALACVPSLTMLGVHGVGLMLVVLEGVAAAYFVARYRALRRGHTT